MKACVESGGVVGTSFSLLHFFGIKVFYAMLCCMILYSLSSLFYLVECKVYLGTLTTLAMVFSIRFRFHNLSQDVTQKIMISDGSIRSKLKTNARVVFLRHSKSILL